MASAETTFTHLVSLNPSSILLFLIDHILQYLKRIEFRVSLNVAVGKLKSSSVSEEKLQFLDKTVEAKRERVLAQYIAFCGKVCGIFTC